MSQDQTQIEETEHHLDLRNLRLDDYDDVKSLMDNVYANVGGAWPWYFQVYFKGFTVIKCVFQILIFRYIDLSFYLIRFNLLDYDIHYLALLYVCHRLN